MLTEARRYFQSFRDSHIEDYQLSYQLYRVGRDYSDHSTGYSPFYRSDEVVDLMSKMYLALVNEFESVAIPERFVSGEKLVKAWRYFYAYLNEQGKLIQEVAEYLKRNPHPIYGNTVASDEELPEVLTGVNTLRVELLEVLRTTLNIAKNEGRWEAIAGWDKAESDSQASTGAEEFFKADILIVTALMSEYEAVLELTGDWTDQVPIAGISMWSKGSWKGKTVVVATRDLKGPTHAASLTTGCLHQFRPSVALMTGIAGATGSTRCEIGDAVICELAIDRDAGKHAEIKGQSVFKRDLANAELKKALRDSIKKFCRQSDFTVGVRSRWKDDKYSPSTELSVTLGRYATGATVVASALKRDEIDESGNSIDAIDMEVFAFYVSCEFGPDPDITYFAVKSICDKSDVAKDDVHQAYAAYTSARVAYEIVTGLLI